MAPNKPHAGIGTGLGSAELGAMGQETYSTLGGEEDDQDGWEQIYYLRSYNDAANRIRQQEASRGSNT